ncbi:phosphodiester glycosidase family protein [Mesorhizobium sp. YC-39]|uniref:phosphodiester glycosidase family protein n=1 Tax=unclassified Mesorhizobium TaxID=325217 RepID=UPI0021E83712|nr:MULTISPECIES: phosphodiester glycosidase family protein [unclassified Mesorhizobium]MCV3209787.1 phosphodiester glycosidase family protein [Mesorhizobium sp. YC-2]MCV3230317.1 phosphodiester glycosidase family protein [Mesorhizobium sp. YC-39]
MKRRHIAAILIGALAVALALIWWFRPSAPPAVIVSGELPAPCKDFSFEAVPYVVCEIDLRSYDIGVFHAGADGKAFGSLEKFDKAMAGEGRPVLLAMNAGMYHEDLSPVGLLVEDGREKAPLNLADCEGNFFLKPNGVFLVRKDGKAAIMETGAYASARPEVAFATQSGPILVIDGRLHPRFEENGVSRYIRNGVGVRDGDTVVLAISRSEVSLGSFARLFRDALHCPNALFFDGVVSALSNGDRMLVGGKYPAGPIVAVSAKKPVSG